MTKLAKSRKLLLAGLLIGVLIGSPSVYGFSADEVQTSSQVAKIGYGNVGKVMSEVSMAKVKSNLINKALSDLFTELASHLKKKNVPDQVVKKFKSQAKSLLSLYEKNAITQKQLGRQVSNIVKNVGRKDPKGKVPVSVMEKAGMSKEAVKKMSKKGVGSEVGVEMAREMAQNRKKKEEENKEEQTYSASKQNGKGKENEKEKENEKDKQKTVQKKNQKQKMDKESKSENEKNEVAKKKKEKKEKKEGKSSQVGKGNNQDKQKNKKSRENDSEDNHDHD